jgi:hypothetical protein
MTFIAAQCLHCHSEQVVKRVKMDSGAQHYLCQNSACQRQLFPRLPQPRVCSAIDTILVLAVIYQKREKLAEALSCDKCSLRFCSP